MPVLTGTIFGIQILTFVASAAILLLAGVAHAVLRWLVRRKVRQDAASAADRTVPGRELSIWIDRMLVAAVPPLALLIWVFAGSAALLMPLGELPAPAARELGARAVVWLRGAATMAALFWLLLRVGRVARAALGSLATRTTNAWDDALLQVFAAAAPVVFPIVALLVGVQALAIPPGLESALRTCISLVLIGAVAVVAYRCVEVFEKLVLQGYRLDVADNLEARAVHTQVTVLKKIAVAAIGIFTLASMLMVFESVRQFGASILASAGIAGIIVGFAAQRSIATLLAGLQIAITQPIRIDDVVIVEGEWGRIEEITLTYVIVRIWDQRRLIVPITHFIEQPFQNWTRSSAEILGTVFLHVDYCAPLEAIRGELDRILAASPHWDGKVKVLQVTGAGAQTLEIRALASAADASRAWDLRCEVREKLVGFLQRHHPESLPRVRAELTPPAPAGA